MICVNLIRGSLLNLSCFKIFEKIILNATCTVEGMKFITLAASSKYTQIQVRPRIAEYGTQGLEIDCLLTRPETVTIGFFIQLSRGEPIKTEKKIVLVLGSGISWQTAGFQNRSTASGQLSPVASANLRFSIRNDSIQCPYDFSEYFCSSSFLTTTSGAVTENTNPAQVSYSGE